MESYIRHREALRKPHLCMKLQSLVLASCIPSFLKGRWWGAHRVATYSPPYLSGGGGCFPILTFSFPPHRLFCVAIIQGIKWGLRIPIESKGVVIISGTTFILMVITILVLLFIIMSLAPLVFVA